MKLLYQTLLVGAATMAMADNLVPINIMRPSCIRFGKCVSDLGVEDASVCCSGVCIDGNCAATAEASSILMRTTLAGAPFLCKRDAFFGVRSRENAYFHSGKFGSDCMCPEGLPCIIGNGDTPLSSNRFWVGECDPDNHACLPQVQISVEMEKTLFESPNPTEDNGPGGPCDSSAMCVPNANICQPACTVHYAETVAGLTDARCGFDFDIVGTGNQRTRSPGQIFSGLCTFTPLSRDLDDSCVCDTDCDTATNANVKCIVPVANNIISFGTSNTEQTLVNDLSFTGKCLIPPGQAGCTEDCHCLPGSECADTDANDTPDTCSIPAGSDTTCSATAPCTAPAACVDHDRDGGTTPTLCKLDGLEECDANEQCETGQCLNGVCTIPVGGSGCAVDEQCENTGGVTSYCVANTQDSAVPARCLLAPTDMCVDPALTLDQQCIGASSTTACTAGVTQCPNGATAEGLQTDGCAGSGTAAIFNDACASGVCAGPTGCTGLIAPGGTGCTQDNQCEGNVSGDTASCFAGTCLLHPSEGCTEVGMTFASQCLGAMTGTCATAGDPCPMNEGTTGSTVCENVDGDTFDDGCTNDCDGTGSPMVCGS